MGVHDAAEIPLQPMKNLMSQKEDGPQGGCDPMGSLHRNTDVSRTCGPMSHYGAVEQPVPGELHFMEETNTGAVHEELHPVEKKCAGEVHGGLSTIGGIPFWSRG